MVLFVCIGQIPKVIKIVVLTAPFSPAALRYLTDVSNCLVAAWDLYIYYSMKAISLSNKPTPKEVGLTTFSLIFIMSWFQYRRLAWGCIYTRPLSPSPTVLNQLSDCTKLSGKHFIQPKIIGLFCIDPFFQKLSRSNTKGLLDG